LIACKGLCDPDHSLIKTETCLTIIFYNRACTDYTLWSFVVDVCEIVRILLGKNKRLMLDSGAVYKTADRLESDRSFI
jgi:hypothetical protein